MSNLALLVPIHKILRFYFSIDIFIYILSFPMIILTFIACVKILKFDSLRWNVLYIFQIFIGIPSSRPRKNIEQKIFLLIGLLSVIYSNIFFSKIEDMKVIYEEKSYDSAREIMLSGMKIYSIHTANPNESGAVRYLLSQRARVNRSEDCLELLIASRSAICIMSLSQEPRITYKKM